jgi:hypothetical protein
VTRRRLFVRGFYPRHARIRTRWSPRKGGELVQPCSALSGLLPQQHPLNRGNRVCCDPFARSLDGHPAGHRRQRRAQEPGRLPLLLLRAGRAGPAAGGRFLAGWELSCWLLEPAPCCLAQPAMPGAAPPLGSTALPRPVPFSQLQQTTVRRPCTRFHPLTHTHVPHAWPQEAPTPSFPLPAEEWVEELLSRCFAVIANLDAPEHRGGYTAEAAAAWFDAGACPLLAGEQGGKHRRPSSHVPLDGKLFPLVYCRSDCSQLELRVCPHLLVIMLCVWAWSRPGCVAG